jgi:hypothetical protein
LLYPRETNAMGPGDPVQRLGEVRGWFSLSALTDAL